MKLYFIIKNSVDEYRSNITRICDTLDEALEEIKDCSDWHCDKGTGFIYEVDNKMHYIHCWDVSRVSGVSQRY